MAVHWTAKRVQEQAARVDVPPSVPVIADPGRATDASGADVAILRGELEALRATVQRLEDVIDDLRRNYPGIPEELGPPLSLDACEGECAFESAIDSDCGPEPNLEDAIIEALGRGPLGFLSLAGELYPDFERSYPDEDIFHDDLDAALRGMTDSYFFDEYNGPGSTVKIMLEDVPADIKNLGDQRRRRQYAGVNPATGKPIYQTVPLGKDELIWREKLKAKIRADAHAAGKKIPPSWERYAPAAIGAGI